MTSRLRLHIATIAALIWLAAGIRTASAQTGSNAVILIAGDASLGDGVRGAATPWLTAHGFAVSDGGLKKKDATKITDCLTRTPDGCADAVAQVGTDRVWFFMIESKPGDAGADANIILRVFGRDGKLLASDEVYCERCRKTSLSTQVEKVLGTVAEAAQSVTAAPTVLHITTSPAGALVEVDGQRIGTTNPELDYTVLPGTHRVVLSHDGYEPATRMVDLQDGEVKDVNVTLEARKPPPPTTTKHREVGLSTYVIGGAGVIALGAGATLVLLNEPSSRDGKLQYHSRDTLLPGAVLAGAGAVAVAFAVYRYIRAPEREDSARVAPSASLSSGGLSFGIVGTF